MLWFQIPFVFNKNGDAIKCSVSKQIFFPEQIFLYTGKLKWIY